MSLRAEVLDALLAAGATAEMIVAAVKADRAADDAREALEREANEARMERKRDGNADRQRRHRERNALSRVTAVSHSDERDETPQVSPNDINSNPLPNPTSPVASQPSRARKPKSEQPQRLPVGWKPERFAECSAAREVVDRRGQPWAKIQLENFRAWAANADDKPGKGRKLDWQSAFAKWINEQDRQEPRNGTIQRNGSPANAGSTDGLTGAIREARALRAAHNDGGMFSVAGVG